MRIGPDDILPISFLATGVNLAKSVGQIVACGSGKATGFLVGEDLIMTCHHAIPNETKASLSYISFDGQKRKLLPANQFLTDKLLDVTICGVERIDLPIIKIRDIPIFDGEPIIIIQYPNTMTGCVELKGLSIRNGFVINKKRGTFIKHTSTTFPGSSGAPVFDFKWQLLGVHANCHLFDEDVMINEFIPVAEIVKWMTSQNLNLCELGLSRKDLMSGPAEVS